MSMESDVKEAAIIKLLEAWSSGSKITDSQIDAYLEVLADVSAEAVTRASKQYREGKVEGHNTEFAPKAATFARQARVWDEAIASLTTGRELRKLSPVVSYPIGQTPPPPMVPLGPIKLEVDGVMQDVSHLSHAEKEHVIKHGTMPPAEGVDPKVAATVTPKLNRM